MFLPKLVSTYRVAEDGGSMFLPKLVSTYRVAEDGGSMFLPNVGIYPLCG
jgi:hypothetical protein